ncbi:MAG: hypothetical protein ACYDH2_14735 [Anaerolineaceae bacterium]
MKKTISVVAGLVLLFALVFVSIPNNVQAGYSVTKQSIAAGEWNTGTMVKVDLTAAPAPEWLQLMTTDAVVLEEPTKICHEFGGGKFHWVGEIRQLKDGRWIKLETTNGWVPDEEGTYLSCAQAPSEGTYALFAYYYCPPDLFCATEAPEQVCGINEELVGGFCVCKSGYTYKDGVCSPKKLF